MRSERPSMPSSSVMTRKPLSDAMKFTVFTRESRSAASRKCFRNMDPLAPVVATVRFSGGKDTVGAPRGLQCEASNAEDRDAAKASQGERWFYRFVIPTVSEVDGAGSAARQLGDEG